MRSFAGRNNGIRPAGMVLLFLGVLLAVVTLLPPSSRGSAEQHLLVLHSYHQGYRWTDDLTRGIEAALQHEGKGIKVHYEYMDTKRMSDAAYFRLLYETYRYKFSNSRFDAIIATDNDAFDFLLDYRDRLFPGTPVVFCGVNDFKPSRLRGARLFTGVNEAADIKATVDLALKLHPHTRRIAVINDTTTTGRVMHKQITDLIPMYRGRVTFTFLEELEMPELLAAVQKLPSDSLVFYTFFFRDKGGRFFEYDEGLSLIASKCPVPIYGVWDFYLGHGMVGGMLTSGYYQGKTAGTMAARILHGERVENIPPVMQSPNRYMFDYRQLRRFGIALSSLPKGSILVNRPANLYSMHRTVFWGIVAALAGLVVIVLLLLRTAAVRRRAEEELRNAAVKYRIVADNTYDWEFWEDPDGRFVYSSPSCECITEYRAEEFLADPGLLLRLIHPDDLLRFEQHRADVTQNMCLGELQFRIILPSGSVRWLDHQCLPVFDDGGEFLGTRGSNRDITLRRQVEEALRLNEARLQALAQLNEMTEATLHEITDFALEQAVRLTRSRIGYLAFTNDDETVLTMSSWSKVAMAGCEVAGTPLEYPVATTGLWGEAVRQRKPIITNDYPAPNPYKKGCPSGHVPLYRHMNAPIFDNGRIVAVAGVGNKEDGYDDTDVRQLTLLMQGMWRLVQRRRANDALRESEERYRTLFEGANDAIFTVRDGVFVNCNRKALEMFRCAAAEFLGRALAEISPPFQMDGSESREKMEEKVAAALGGTPQFFEWQHRRCDGTLFHAEVSLNRVEYRGEVELQAIIRDVTERKAMDRMKDEMISAVSHEMRTPLTAMLGFTEFLLENEVDPGQQKEYLRIVYHETERLSELIGNFLDLQRIKARQAAYQFKPLAVRPLLEEVAALFTGASQKHRITVHCPQDLPLIVGDETSLHQVLNNLLSNAIKYSPGGGEVILGARRDEGTITLWVKDEGIGIAPEALDKIFERFYRVDSTDRRATGGTGLGLALVREIVLAHGGRVWVESTMGKGSTFYLSLPIAQRTAGADTEGRA